MPEIFNRRYDRRALETRVGDLRQLGGITPIKYDEGRARGTLPFLEPGETREYELEFDVQTLRGGD